MHPVESANQTPWETKKRTCVGKTMQFPNSQPFKSSETLMSIELIQLLCKAYDRRINNLSPSRHKVIIQSNGREQTDFVKVTKHVQAMVMQVSHVQKISPCITSFQIMSFHFIFNI
jgi:hypothetical protein